MKKIAAIVTTALLVVGLSACQGEDSSAQTTGQAQTEEVFDKAQDAVPYPKDEIGTAPLERANLAKKLIRENDPDKIGYVYILSFGKFIGYYTIKGKVSSNQSQMTTSELIVRPCSGCDRVVVTAPGDDASYGENEQGIFFFTSQGALVKTSADYLYSDQPLAVQNVPELNS